MDTASRRVHDTTDSQRIEALRSSLDGLYGLCVERAEVDEEGARYFMSPGGSRDYAINKELRIAGEVLADNA